MDQGVGMKKLEIKDNYFDSNLGLTKQSRCSFALLTREQRAAKQRGQCEMNVFQRPVFRLPSHSEPQCSQAIYQKVCGMVLGH